MAAFTRARGQSAFDSTARKRTVIDGRSRRPRSWWPGTGWQVRSIDEAIEWLKRAPFDAGTYEIRQIFDTEGM